MSDAQIGLAVLCIIVFVSIVAVTTVFFILRAIFRYVAGPIIYSLKYPSSDDVDENE